MNTDTNISICPSREGAQERELVHAMKRGTARAHRRTFVTNTAWLTNHHTQPNRAQVA